MNSFWLDSDVLIWAKDNIAPFGYAAFSGFWELIGRNMASGLVKITKRNFHEITEGRNKEDDLAKWLKLRFGAMGRASRPFNASTSRVRWVSLVDATFIPSLALQASWVMSKLSSGRRREKKPRTCSPTLSIGPLEPLLRLR